MAGTPMTDAEGNLTGQALEAASVAEAKAALATEMADWLREARERAGKVAGTFSGDWLARYDALTPAADAAEGGKG